jgi:hypothetical protein
MKVNRSPRAGGGSVETNSVVELRKKVVPDSAAEIVLAAATTSAGPAIPAPASIVNAAPDSRASVPPDAMTSLSPLFVRYTFGPKVASAISRSSLAP